jgi:hypothetical protein
VPPASSLAFSRSFQRSADAPRQNLGSPAARLWRRVPASLTPPSPVRRGTSSSRRRRSTTSKIIICTLPAEDIASWIAEIEREYRPFRAASGASPASSYASSATSSASGTSSTGSRPGSATSQKSKPTPRRLSRTGSRCRSEHEQEGVHETPSYSRCGGQSLDCIEPKRDTPLSLANQTCARASYALFGSMLSILPATPLRSGDQKLQSSPSLPSSACPLTAICRSLEAPRLHGPASAERHWRAVQLLPSG